MIGDCTIRGNHKTYICGLLSNFDVEQRMQLRVLILLLVSFGANAQSFELSKKYERLLDGGYAKGYIVTNDSDTLNGILKFRKNSTDEVSSLWFFNSEGKRNYIEPLDITGLKCGYLKYYSNEGSIFLILYEGDHIDLVKNVTAMSNMQIIRDFALSYVENETNGYLSAEFLDPLIPEFPLLFLRFKEDQRYVEIRRKDFKSNYAQIFEDCNEVVVKIDNGDYEYKDLNSLVREFDSCYD
jgi:hypothetical protein